MKDDNWQWHYVGRNEACRYPRRIVCLDTEAYRSLHGTVEQQHFMLGVASFDRMSARTLQTTETQWIETDETGELWNWITSHTKDRERLVCFAHNMGYDARISQAFTQLPSLGFRLRFISLDSRRCYARFSRGTATLVLADTTSFFPKSLDYIAGELGYEKLPLPDAADPPDKWFARCKRDAQILRHAVLELLTYLERNDSGNFKPTGPAQAWATYRHRFLPRKTLLVHHDEEALEAERAAAWTGRTEVWKHGEYNYPLAEYDYRLAYATIATQEYVPVRFVGTSLHNCPLSELPRNAGESRLLRCSVSQDRPIVPTAMDGRIGWPVGQFETTLWDREAQLAETNGAEVTVSQSWRYRTAPILKEWGEWIIQNLTNEDANVSPLIRIMLKHWARCLIGRFAMRYPDWHSVGQSDNSDLVHFDCYELDGDAQSEYLQIANDWYTCEGRKDGHDTAPAVMSYVMALQRIKLWEAIQTAGDEEVYYCDTDSLIVSGYGATKLDGLRSRRGHDNLVRKNHYRHAEFYSPRAIILDGEPRISGLPRRARQTSRLTYKLETWQTLSDSLKSGDPTTVRVSPQAFRIPTQDHRRRHLADGRTEPFTVSLA